MTAQRQLTAQHVKFRERKLTHLEFVHAQQDGTVMVIAATTVIWIVQLAMGHVMKIVKPVMISLPELTLHSTRVSVSVGAKLTSSITHSSIFAFKNVQTLVNTSWITWELLVKHTANLVTLDPRVLLVLVIHWV